MPKLRVFSKNKENSSSSPRPNDQLDKPLNSPSTSSSFFAATPSSPHTTTMESQGKLSHELAPIVTLLSAQSHRKYHEGMFMLLRDLNSEGQPADRQWLEVYGIIIGNELAYWDLEQVDGDNVDSTTILSTKPSYLNFSDGTFKTYSNLPSATGSINNVIVLSTTLKNRFLLQFAADDEFDSWSNAFRLAAYEYKSLQEAYTASLLSARGSLLSDIRVILSQTKFEYEDWTSVRFGAGMPWKRCFTVIEPCKTHKKGFKAGKMYFYESDKKSKKHLMASVTVVHSVYAVYPRNYTIIDKSTMIKLDGSIQFDPKEEARNCSIFLMPEQHSSVPLYDTLIRFLIPIMDSFNLYGRPVKLNANKNDENSLLFGLPVLPKVHYLEVSDLKAISQNKSSINWDQDIWNTNMKQLLKSKMNKGSTGCGSRDGFNGALDLLNSSKELADGKIKFFVNKPEANKYLENSPQLKSGKFSSSEEQTLKTSTSGHQSNIQINIIDDDEVNLEMERNRSNLITQNILNNNEEKGLYSNSVHDQLSPSKTNTSITPQKQQDQFPESSPSPQVLNIYQKYSQIPEFEKLSNDKSIANLSERLENTDLYGNKVTDEQNTDNLYPSNAYDDEDEDDEEEDDDEDNSGFNFVSSTRKISNFNDASYANDKGRIVSPFTDFNNNYNAAMNSQAFSGTSPNTKTTIPHSAASTNLNHNSSQLLLPKQRSPKKDSYFPTEEERDGRKALDSSRKLSGLKPDYGNGSNQRAYQHNNSSGQNLHIDPPNKEFSKRQGSSAPQTPIDQQNAPAPQLVPMKQRNHPGNMKPVNDVAFHTQAPSSTNFSMANQRSDSPTGQNFHRKPAPPPNGYYGQQLTNSPELIPPHQYQKHQPVPQLQQPSSNHPNSGPNPLNSPNLNPKPAFSAYGPMKLAPSGTRNQTITYQEQQLKQQQQQLRPNVNYPPHNNHRPQPAQHQHQHQHQHQQPPPPPQHQQPISQYRNHTPHQRLPPPQQGYPPQLQPQQQNYASHQQGYNQQGHHYQQGYPSQKQKAYPPNNNYYQGQPPPQQQGYFPQGQGYQQIPTPPHSAKSFKHDPYALAKKPLN